MKKIIIYLFILSGVINLKAQTNADCINAIPLCTTPNFTFFSTAGNGNVNDIPTGNNISNPSTNPNPPNAGCLLSGENVPQWLLITIGNPGTLEFVFGAGNSANPQVGYYDWAMWPYTTNSCAGIMNNTLPPIRCNWNATSSGGTGIASAGNIPPGGNSGNFQPPLQVNACQQFIICISNYSGVNTLVSFQSLGTASLSCNPNCNPNYIVCAGSSATIVPVNFNGLTNASYSMQPGGATNTTGSFVVTPSVTTSYTTFITGTNSNNAIQTTTAVSTVSVKPQPSLAPSFTQATCANSNNAVSLGLSFSPSSPVPGYTVNWSPTPGSVTSNTQTSATNLNSGVTNVTVTAAGGCSTTTSFNMVNVVPPTMTLVNVSGSYSITCKTPSIDLIATSNYTNGNLNYSWSSISFTANTQSVSIVQTGTYNVCVTDPVTACSACQSFTINQNTTIPTFTVNPVNQLITCNSSAATFTSTALSPTTNITHEWYCPQNPYPVGPPTFTSGGVTSLLNTACGPGTYTVVLLDNVNGCVDTKTVSVTSIAGFPSFNTASTSNYSLGCSPLNQSTLSAINATSASGPVQYLFLPPGTPSAVPIPSVAFGAQASTMVAVPGTWTIVVQDPINGCQTALSVPILQNTVAPAVSASFAPASQTLTCFNPTILATGLSSTPNTIISWNLPSPAFPPTVASPTIILGPPNGPNTSPTSTVYANYTVMVTNTVNACKSTYTVVVNQNFIAPTPSLAAGNPSVINCSGNPVTLSFTNNAVANAGIPGATATATWYGPTPQIPLTGATYSAYVAGIYTVSIQNSKNGCLGTKTFTVPDLTQPPVIAAPSATAPSGCGDDAPLTVTLAQSLSAWSLYYRTYPDGASFKPANAIQPVNSPTYTGASATVTVDLTGVYQYVVTNMQTGCFAVGMFTVIPGGLNANFTTEPSSGYAPLNVGFNNTSATSTGATSSITSVWAFGNGTSSVTTNPAPGTTYNSPGTYTVMMISTRGGCIDTAYQVVKVDIPSKLEIPNVFTPNGDGSNDLFFLHTTNITSITASIFDRWGNKVYEVTSETGNIAWDGKNQAGKECPAGTYFYIIKSTGKDAKAYDQKGNVSLYR